MSTQLQTGPHETLATQTCLGQHRYRPSETTVWFLTVPLSAVVRARCKWSESVTQLCVHKRFHSPHIKIINLHCAKYRTRVDAYMALYDASIHKGNEHPGSIKLAGNQFSTRHTQNHVLREQSAYWNNRINFKGDRRRNERHHSAHCVKSLNAILIFTVRKRNEVIRTRRDCIMRSSKICIPHQTLCWKSNQKWNGRDRT